MSLDKKPQMVGGGGFLLVVSGVLLMLILTVAYFFYGLQPSFKAEGAVLFKISKGESFRNIGARLSQQGLVRSISVFKFYSLILGKAHRFQPGTYTLSSNISVPEIVRVLTTPGMNEKVVTIPEGLALRDVDYLLTKAGVIGDGDLIRFRLDDFRGKYQFLQGVQSVEGFLFPDTYRFELGSSAEKVVDIFFRNFEVKAWPVLEDKKEWYESLILASYLEREVPGFADRQTVAGVLLKRLSLGMALQVDATISYAKCNGRLLGCAGIKIARADLHIASPYNTYQKVGLTPTPISNPGMEAIKAAMEPKKSSYLYYLSAVKSGATIYARTLEEHNLNRQKYL